MSEYEAALLAKRNEVVAAFIAALQNGVTLPRCLEILGVEGKARTMLRAMLSRYDEGQLAELLSGVRADEPSIEGLEPGAETAILPVDAFPSEPPDN
jgi:hypothetical protein